MNSDLLQAAYGAVLTDVVDNKQVHLSNPTINDVYARIAERHGEDIILGVVYPATVLNTINPVFDRTVYFVAGENGTYTEFNSIEIDGEIALIKREWPTGWAKITIAKAIGGGSGSGGHILIDKAGSELLTRTKFKGEEFIEFYNPDGKDYAAARIDPAKIKQVEYVKVYNMPDPAKILLNAPENWTATGEYIGDPLQSVKAGMKHQNADYLYEIFPNGLPVRTPRTGDKHTVYDVNHQIYIGVEHGLGKKPAVTILDVAGNEVEANVVHIDLNNATITWSEYFTGKVFFN